MSTVCGAPTGTATTTERAPQRRAQSAAAVIVAPVASPSSTRMQRRPRMSARGRAPCRRRSIASASARAWATTVPTPSGRASGSARRYVPPAVTAPIAYSGWNWMADLAHRQGVESQPQACRNLGGDLDAPACQADDDAGANPHSGQPVCELAACVLPVAEHAGIVQAAAHNRIPNLSMDERDSTHPVSQPADCDTSGISRRRAAANCRAERLNGSAQPQAGQQPPRRLRPLDVVCFGNAADAALPHSSRAEALSRVALAAALIALFALGLSGPARADRHVGSFRGLGTWIDLYDGSLRADPEAAVAAMRSDGGTPYLETSNEAAPPRRSSTRRSVSRPFSRRRPRRRNAGGGLVPAVLWAAGV